MNKKLLVIISVILVFCTVLSGCQKVKRVVRDYPIRQLDEEDEFYPVSINDFEPLKFFSALEEIVDDARYDINKVYLSNYLGDSSRGAFAIRWGRDLSLESMYFEFSIEYAGTAVHVFTCKYMDDGEKIRIEKIREENNNDNVSQVTINELLGSFRNVEWALLEERQDFPAQSYYYLSMLADGANIVTTSTTYEDLPTMDTADVVYAIDRDNNITSLDPLDSEAKFPRRSFVFTLNGQSETFSNRSDIIICADIVRART